MNFEGLRKVTKVPSIAVGTVGNGKQSGLVIGGWPERADKGE